MSKSDPRRSETAFGCIFEDIRDCKNELRCPNLTIRSFYFEPNPDTYKQWLKNRMYMDGIDTKTVFVCESPGGSAKGRVPENDSTTVRCWNESRAPNERFHSARKKYGFLNCYLTNTVKCGVRKGGRHSDAEIEACAYFLIRELNLIKPVIVVGVGDNASRTLRKRIIPELKETPILFHITHYSARRAPESFWDEEFPVLVRLQERFSK